MVNDIIVAALCIIAAVFGGITIYNEISPDKKDSDEEIKKNIDK